MMASSIFLLRGRRFPWENERHTFENVSTASIGRHWLRESIFRIHLHYFPVNYYYVYQPEAIDIYRIKLNTYSEGYQCWYQLSIVSVDADCIDAKLYQVSPFYPRSELTNTCSIFTSIQQLPYGTLKRIFETAESNHFHASKFTPHNVSIRNVWTILAWMISKTPLCSVRRSNW